jgi:hypothetical protein
MTPEGSDKYWVGRVSANATRYRITPKVAGVKGVVATVIGKQPGDLLMWITRGESPTLVRFEGPIFIVVPSGVSYQERRCGNPSRVFRAFGPNPRS